jgi:CheY-like chemotaxis protein
MSKGNEKKKKPPYVVAVDDDIDINRLIEHRLKALGCEVKTFLEPVDFLKEIKVRVPDLCLIDINIGRPGVGFKIIEAIRSKLGSKPPIIVLSAMSSQQFIAHAIEVGADDYLIKPPAKEHFTEMISKYINLGRTDFGQMVLRAVPEDEQAARINFDVVVSEVREFGIHLVGSDLLAKGAAITLAGPVIESVTGRPGTILVSIASNWINPDTGLFGAIAEFDPTDERLLKCVRTWILSENAKSPPSA